MKKIFIGLFMLLVTSVAFSETKFLGVSFNLTQSEAETNKTEEKLETKLEELFITNSYCKDIDVDFEFDKTTKKLKKIEIDFEYKGNSVVKSFIDSYIVNNLNCKYINGSFFNDELVINVSDIANEYSLDIYDRKPFSDLLDSLQN